MNRTDIINHLIKLHSYKKYLEIGVQDYYQNLDKIDIELKHGVDPQPRNKCDYVMTSNKFFEQLDDQYKYDIIFIDGLHLTEQVDLDLINSLKHLSENGTIVMHDCHPTDEREQFREQGSFGWMGDVWKSVAKLRRQRTDLEIEVIDTDCGCGIIRRTNIQQLHLGEFELNWENYVKYQKEILNLISISDFLAKYK